MKPGICFRSRKFESHIIFIGQSYFFKTNNTNQFSHIGFGDVGELINKYTPLKSWAELDNLKWNNAPRGNVYTISWLPDYDSEQHPANVGCVEVVRMGGGVTAQILYADNFKMYIRTFLGKEDARWTAWTQV